jgi:enediyne biosynthesis protein E4
VSTTLSKRSFLQYLLHSGLLVPIAPTLGFTSPGRDSAPLGPASSSQSGLGYTFSDVAHAAGLKFRNYYGGVNSKKYIIEANGCGVAFFDYDNDGWLDVFLLNGSRLKGFPPGEQPSNRLFRNNRNGTFTDVTEKANLVRHGWGQGVCVGDYDNDGLQDLFVTYWGHNVLYHNNGDGTFTDVSREARVAGERPRWGTGCAFVDYDRDGKLDLFVSNYLAFDLRTAPDPGTNPYCIYRSLAVNCGPRGLQGETNLLYHNNGDGTFTDASEKAGITRSSRYYGLSVLTADFDNDGWPDIYVADDDTPCILYHNNRDGTFTDNGLMAGVAFDANGRVTAGMGVTAGDYDCNGWLDIFRTNFSDETPTLYQNNGDGNFTDATYAAGVGKYNLFVGWGCGFFDPDNDGWADIFYCNGHVYPELSRAHLDVKYREPRVLYRNLRNGRFEDVSDRAGACITTPSTSRGCAFGDFDNDGDADIVINNMNDDASLLRCDRTNDHHWTTILAVGTKSNRSAIGARVRCVTGNHAQIDEVRSGGSYLSQNDLRIHFGLGTARRVDLLEIRWPSGKTDVFRNLAADRIVEIHEGQSHLRG